jgi:hypothetical protein
MGKTTISMAMFNSKLLVLEVVDRILGPSLRLLHLLRVFQNSVGIHWLVNISYYYGNYGLTLTGW